MEESNREIISELNVEQLNNLIETIDNSYKNIILVKFTADWCSPCKKIKPMCDKYFESLPKKVIIFEIDIDSQLNLYMFFKKSTIRLVSGIPAMLMWTPNTERDKKTWYIPENSFSGGDINELENFFEDIKEKSEDLL